MCARADNVAGNRMFASAFVSSWFVCFFCFRWCRRRLVCYLCFSLGSTIITISVWVRVFVWAKRVRKVYLLQIMFLRWILFIFSRQYLFIKSITNKHTYAGIDRRRISGLLFMYVLNPRLLLNGVAHCVSMPFIYSQHPHVIYLALFSYSFCHQTMYFMRARKFNTSSTDNSHTKNTERKNWWNFLECGKCILFSQIVCERFVWEVFASFVH